MCRPTSHLENWSEGHDGQGDVHLNISSTFVNHLERLFIPKNQDNLEKGHLVVSQTFDLNFLPFQGHKSHFPQVIFNVKFPAFFKSAFKNRGSHLRKRSFLHLTLKIYLKVKIDSTPKCSPRSWSTFVRNIFSYIIVYYVPRHTMRVIAWRATMFAGDRSQGVVEA